jgi:eukaryotic-like serine/threonine-protein kinase
MARLCPVCGTTYPDTVRFCPDDASTLRAIDDGGDLIGEVIADRYQVTALLGEGGMGRVYVARHVRLPQQVAIKVLHPSLVKDASAVARFNREAANAARIEHDRVARVFDFGETGDGAVYLAMEFVAGRTLRAVLAGDPPLAPTRAANLIYQIADGLDAAHRLQIVHRDLKPDNILVATDEQGVDRVKIVDFGIAKALDGRDAKLTQTGMAVGTPEFMSPEQLFGEDVDARSDVYALGLVAFQCLTGTLPFLSDTPERAMTARLGAKPKPLAVVRPGVDWPSSLQVAFDGALAAEPTDRTASALAFGDAVVSAVEGWTGQSVLRGRTPLSSTAIPLPTPPVGVPPVSSSSPVLADATASAAAAAPRAVAATSGRPTWLLPAGGLAVVAAIAAVLFTRGHTTSPSAVPPAGAPPAAPAATPAGTATPPPVGDAGTPTPTSARPSAVTPPATAVGTATPPPAAGTGTASARPTTTDSPTAPGSPPAPAPAAGAESADARRALDAIRRELSEDAADETTARQAIPRIERLLPRLGSATDSSWAYLALVGAHGLAGNPARACAPLRSARALATTSAQERAVQAFFESGQLTCAP